MKPAVLVIDDKPNMLGLLSKVLARTARVVTARGVRTALRALEKGDVAAVLCDLRLDDGDGLEVLRAVRARWPGVPFILMTAYATVPTAVQAMREGAYDYVTKPFDTEALRAIVARALAQAAVLGGEASEPDGFGALVGQGEAMRAMFRLLERVAPTDTTVLVSGEPGTGKELCARTVHERSARAAKRPVIVDCAAIPRPALESELFGHERGAFQGALGDRPGLFEDADGSTLILEGVAELRPTLQAKVARVLDERVVRRIGEARERRVDVRVVATSHRDLRAMVREGSFREELWFQLNVCVLALPPLRDRTEDIPLLARRFLAELPRRARLPATRFSDQALAAMQLYGWPGNVRELKSAVERAAILSDGPEIGLDALPAEIRESRPLRLSSASDVDLTRLSYREAVDVSREETNRRYLEAVLRHHRGDVVAAAEHAGIERESFYRLLRRSGLAVEDFRAGREDTARKN